MTICSRGHRAVLVLVVVLTLAASGCAGEDSGGDTVGDAVGDGRTEQGLDGPATEEATGTAPEATDDESTLGGTEVDEDAHGVEVGGDPDDTPTITLPDDDPPEELTVVDLIEGDGQEAPVGSTVTTHYVGVSWLNDGVQFDSSWERGEPSTFPLDGVIAGWTEGIPGMRVGGRRLLIIPPEMAYGADTPSPDIAPDDTLVFVIDLVDVQ